MKIYKILNDFENYLSFTIDNGELFSKMPFFSAKFKACSRLGEWVKPNGVFYQSDNYTANNMCLPSITTWLLGNLILNEIAYINLKPFLDDYGEFLETSCEGVTYYIFNCLNILPDYLIDEDMTKEKTVSGVYMGLESLAFNNFNKNEYIVFKTNADKLSHLYCTELFVDLINENGFKGLVFSEDLSSV